MKRIKLTRGKFAKVDDEDFEWLNQWKWFYAGTGYAARHILSAVGEQKTIWMHRLIANTPVGMDTDHIDGNGLNNQRNNLRVCTTAENLHNSSVHVDNLSGYKGVMELKSGKWRARICVNGRRIHLGYFVTAKEAARVYDEAALKYYGKFSHLNYKRGSI